MKLLVAVLAAVATILAARLNRSLIREETLVKQNAIVADSLLFVTGERATIVQALDALSKREWAGEDVLSGTKLTGSPARFRAGDADIVYVLDEGCAFCLQNYPLLDSLHREGVRIVGVSHHGSAASLRDYIMNERIKFPLLVDPSGPLASLTDIFATPITLFLRGNRMVGFRVGRFSREEATAYLKLGRPREGD